MLYMVTFTIKVPPMLVYIPYMDPMGNIKHHPHPPKKTRGLVGRIFAT
jgi:hypothetical protein